MFRGNAQVLDLARLNRDVLAFSIFIALDDLIFFDRRGSLIRGLLDSGSQDLLVSDPFAGFAAYLMKMNLALRFGSDKQFHPKGNQRYLNLTRPVRTCHSNLVRRRCPPLVRIPYIWPKMPHFTEGAILLRVQIAD